MKKTTLIKIIVKEDKTQLNTVLCEKHLKEELEKLIKRLKELKEELE